MNTNTNRLLGFGFAMLLATSAFALNNDGHRIRKVETLKGGNKVYIHLESDIKEEPSCSNQSRIVSCSLGDEFCKQALKIALAARLSGRSVDIGTDTGSSACLSSVTTFNRLRIR